MSASNRSADGELDVHRSNKKKGPCLRFYCYYNVGRRLRPNILLDQMPLSDFVEQIVVIHFANWFGCFPSFFT